MPHATHLQPDTAFPPRLLLSLLIATLLHAALLSLPLPLPSKTRADKTPIRVTIVHNDNKATAPTGAPDKNDEAEITSDAAARSTPAKENDAGRINRPQPEPAATAPTTINRDEAITKALRQSPATGGAKERSTVFDPRLAERLAEEHNRVKKFKSSDTEYMTANGTFIRQGDRCWELQKLSPDDTSSEPSQWFRIKCTKRRRSEEDIDRLARKYGIP